MSPLDDEDDGSGDDDDRDLVVLPSSIFYLGIPNLLDTGARWGREIVEGGRPPSLPFLRRDRPNFGVRIDLTKLQDRMK